MPKGFCDKVVYEIERGCALISCSFLSLNICDILIGVFSRYFFHTSFIWTEELARYSLIWMVMVGASCAHVRGDMMAIDFVMPKFPLFLQRLCSMLRVIIGIVVLGLMIYLGTVNALGNWKVRTMGMGIPKTIPLLSLPVGLGVLFIEFVLYRDKRGIEQ
ncbi:MAG: TRAP transporter small permease [Acetomicrobium sp.]|jgi:TRAP-type C4-dicarboxylate transport system permease small subunit